MQHAHAACEHQLMDRWLEKGAASLAGGAVRGIKLTDPGPENCQGQSRARLLLPVTCAIPIRLLYLLLLKDWTCDSARQPTVSYSTCFLVELFCNRPPRTDLCSVDGDTRAIKPAV